MSPQIADKELKCLYCGHDQFKEIKTKLNQKWLSILDLEMFSPSGMAYLCKQCGYKHEFFNK